MTRPTPVSTWTPCAQCPLLIIPHSTRILEALHVDAAHVMENGVIVKNGGAELVEAINEKGFGSLKTE